MKNEERGKRKEERGKKKEEEKEGDVGEYTPELSHLQYCEFARRLISTNFIKHLCLIPTYKVSQLNYLERMFEVK
jgi:hypothetical protein